jgi:shikimate dehydrogenase
MRKLILIGDPVAHSRSPAMQNAALARLGVAARYEAVHTPADELAARVAALRAPEYLGANVTLPHKQAVPPLLDELEGEAAQIGAVNTIYKGEDGRLIGANTDAPALIADLADAGFDPAGRSAVLLGASGAARAAAFALAWAGVGALTVLNRTPERAEALLAELLLAITDEHGLTASGERPPTLVALGLDDPDAGEHLAACELLVNATAIGWHGDETPLPDPPVGRHALVYDMTYRETRLLREAAARGAATRAGLGMLVHQGALALTRWTGREAPLDVMWAALGQ